MPALSVGSELYDSVLYDIIKVFLMPALWYDAATLISIILYRSDEQFTS